VLDLGWAPSGGPGAIETSDGIPVVPLSTTDHSPGAEGMENGARMTQVCPGGSGFRHQEAEEFLQGGVGVAQLGHGFGDHCRPVGPEDVDVSFADDAGNEVVEFVGELNTSRGQFKVDDPVVVGAGISDNLLARQFLASLTDLPS
jgi:hypothetical protein